MRGGGGEQGLPLAHQELRILEKIKMRTRTTDKKEVALKVNTGFTGKISWISGGN